MQIQSKEILPESLTHAIYPDGCESWTAIDQDGCLWHLRPNSPGRTPQWRRLPSLPGKTYSIKKMPSSRIPGRAISETLDQLSKLKNEFNSNIYDSVRLGVALFLIAKQQEAQGHRLAFLDNNNNPIHFVTL